MKTKICTKCNSKYSATIEYFNRDKYTKDGLTCACKYCRRCYGRGYAELHREKRKRYSKKYHQSHQEQSNNYRQRYYTTLKGYLNTVYYNLHHRCNNSSRKDYKYYGGRGIKNKFKSRKEFINYIIGELQIDPRGLQIDRIDNDGHYEPGNIRFVTRSKNQRNKRNSNG